MTTDLTAKFLGAPKEMADFMVGARDYWSTHTLMQGYGEVAKGITDLVEDATRHADPLTQSLAGSGLGVGKLMGAIPIGLYHWGIETLRATKFHGIGGGFKTFIGTPIEGFVEGGKFVLNQAKRWSDGEISNSTFGVADEVATTLGTAALMFFGLKAIHTGGTGLINGLKNIELPTPLVTDTGHVMPVPVGAGAISGGGSLVEGLVFMAAAKPASDSPSQGDSGNPIDFKQIAKEAAYDDAALSTLKYFAKNGDLKALSGLIELAKNDPNKSIATLKELAEGGLANVVDGAVNGIVQIFWENSSSALDALLELARKHGNRSAIAKIMEMDLEAVLKTTEPDRIKEFKGLDDKTRLLINRARMLEVKALGGDEQALHALGELAKNGDPHSYQVLWNFFTDNFFTKFGEYVQKLFSPTTFQLKVFEILKQLPNNGETAQKIAEYRFYEIVPVELGTPVLNWLIMESIKNPRIAEAILRPRMKFVETNEILRHIGAIYKSADYSYLYRLAEKESQYRELLQFVIERMKMNNGSAAKRAELQGVLDRLGTR